MSPGASGLQEGLGHDLGGGAPGVSPGAPGAGVYGGRQKNPRAAGTTTGGEVGTWGPSGVILTE